MAGVGLKFVRARTCRFRGLAIARMKVSVVRRLPSVVSIATGHLPASPMLLVTLTVAIDLVRAVMLEMHMTLVLVLLAVIPPRMLAMEALLSLVRTLSLSVVLTCAAVVLYGIRLVYMMMPSLGLARLGSLAILVGPLTGMMTATAPAVNMAGDVARFLVAVTVTAGLLVAVSILLGVFRRNRVMRLDDLVKPN